MAGTGDSGGASINVVPLIDIVLVLLIIFMVVTPMLQKGVDVKLPKAQNVVKIDERTANNKVIAIKADRTMYLDKQKLSEDELRTALASIYGTSPNTPILVKGDERVNFGDVRKIVIDAQKAGFKVVNIATESESGKKGGG